MSKKKSDSEEYPTKFNYADAGIGRRMEDFQRQQKQLEEQEKEDAKSYLLIALVIIVVGMGFFIYFLTTL